MEGGEGENEAEESWGHEVGDGNGQSAFVSRKQAYQAAMKMQSSGLDTIL